MAGDAYAAKLSADGKTVYSASIANKLTSGNYPSIVERETTNLETARKIDSSSATCNGVSAGD